jgi:hypothetical protein
MVGAAGGAVGGAYLTPKLGGGSQFDPPDLTPEGFPMDADATFTEGFTHGFWDTNKPGAKMARTLRGRLIPNELSKAQIEALRYAEALRSLQPPRTEYEDNEDAQ